MSKQKENPSSNSESHDEIVKLVSQAKHRPLPKSTKALTVIVMVGLIFTGGIAYGKHKATDGTGAGLSLAGLTSGGFGGGFGAGFGGRNRTGASGTTGTPGDLSNGAVPSDFGAAPTVAAADVAGTVVSITPTKVVIETLSGDKQSFPLQTSTRVRESTAGTLAGVKAGDIVTIKPDSSNNAKTITVVK